MEKRGPTFSGYKLFTEEFFLQKKDKKKKKGKGKETGERSKGHVLREAWNQLSDKERAEFSARAEQLRAPGKGKTYVVPFLTRSSPKQFMAVCNKLKDRPDVMSRLKKIGFHKLVNVSCPQINRDLCAEFMTHFDPPTKQVSIRGESRGVGAEDVSKILGLPHGGSEIRVEVQDENVVFKELRSVYKNIKYQTLGEWLMGPADENFEFLFIIFALGTLLDPSASIYVSDRVLKLMTVTKDALGQFDWSSFIVKELCAAIEEYQRELRKGKGRGRKTVGGCLYFLMMFCLQYFPLGNVKALKDDDALTFWDEENVKRRVQSEKKTKKGLLYAGKVAGGQSSSTFNADTMLTHPEIRRTYYKLVDMVGEELLALQNRLGADHNKEDDIVEEEADEEEVEDIKPEGEEEGVNEEADEAEGHEKDAASEGEEEGVNEEAEHGEDASPESQQNEKEKESDEVPEVDKGGKELIIHIEDVGGNEGGQPEEKQVLKGEDEGNVTKGSDLDLRRSKRVITPSWIVKSPWLDTTKKLKGKRKVDDKDVLFELCTTRCTDEQGDQEFVDMYGYFITRRELYCLRPKGWINDRVMSMVARTLVEDQKQNGGTVRRHIFTPDLMQKIIADPQRWSSSDYETQFLPEHIGYNIGDCEFIFGPALHHDHWFCYAIDMKTMKFYALDSLVDTLTYMRKQREREEAKKFVNPQKAVKKATANRKGRLDPKELMATRVRSCFIHILRRVKPELFAQEHKFEKEVTWAKVHVQADTDSCGVHVLSWLQMWDATVQAEDEYTMPFYSNEDLHEMKVGVLWWLVTHPQNTHAGMVLSLLEDMQKRRRTH